jgi:hypothetical protein
MVLWYLGYLCTAARGTFRDGNVALLIFMDKRRVTMAVELGPFAVTVTWTAVYFEYGFDILSKIFRNFVSHFTCAVLSSCIKRFFLFVTPSQQFTAPCEYEQN